MSNQIQYWSDMTTLDSHHGESVYENIYKCNQCDYYNTKALQSESLCSSLNQLSQRFIETLLFHAALVLILGLLSLNNYYQ